MVGISKTIFNFATDMSKNLYIIAGCNGAGKTTASYTVLPEILHCKEFVNADTVILDHMSYSIMQNYVK